MKNSLLTLTVVSGPDAGMSRSFRKNRITIGRDRSNDFVLRDGFVSNRHGAFVHSGEATQYQDLKSRHGSVVVVNNVSTQLHDPARVSTLAVLDGAELQVGSSVLRVDLPETRPMESEAMAETINVSDGQAHRGREQFITAAHQPIHALTRRFDSHDRRLELLFKLAENLNALTGLEDILELIADTTFDAFSGANFFALTLLESDDDGHVESVPRPYLTRTRSQVPEGDQPILSSSILQRVIETREAVLWVKDSMDVDVSQSILDAKITACLCAPLVGQRKLMGVMQVDTRGRGSLFSRQDLELFSVLASNAAFAVERAELTANIVNMFESFVDASVTAIEARDPTTAGHSHRVTAYTLELARVVHDLSEPPFEHIRFTDEQFTEMRYGGLLHDFGKIVVPAHVLQKATRLPEKDMAFVRQRFEAIKALSRGNLWRTWGEAMASGVNAPGMIAADAIEERYTQFEAEIDDAMDFLEAVNIKGFLPDEDIARVRAIGERQYVDIHNVSQPYLTPSEVENLTIRKGTLNEQEWELMKSHSAQSQRFLERIPWGDDLKLIPYLGGAHHEKLDGSGYPLGLDATQLNVQVRMLTICDIFDALTAADRPYRKAASVDRALKILHLEAGDGKLDQALVDAFEVHVVPQILHMIPSLQRELSP